MSVAEDIRGPHTGLSGGFDTKSLRRRVVMSFYPALLWVLPRIHVGFTQRLLVFYMALRITPIANCRHHVTNQSMTNGDMNLIRSESGALRSKVRSPR